MHVWTSALCWVSTGLAWGPCRGGNELGTLPLSQNMLSRQLAFQNLTQQQSRRGREVAMRRCATTLPCEANDSEL